ncbi:hypothetical protein [Gemmatimonas sp.]|uniref:hypothetical protein n=1 Tax=Gemmatimonas sp. TaxID=1962908 RepID=UPI003565E90E
MAPFGEPEQCYIKQQYFRILPTRDRDAQPPHQTRQQLAHVLRLTICEHDAVQQ